MLNLRRYLLGSLVAVVIIAATGAWKWTGRPLPWQGIAEAQSRPQPTVAFRRVWAIPQPDYRVGALSADGAYVGVVGETSDVSLWQVSRNKRKWRRSLAGASQIAVTDAGAYVLVLTTADPTHPALMLLKGADGAVISKTPLDGAVWDWELAADGSAAGIVTGNRSLYYYTLGSRPGVHRETLEGIGNSIALAPNGSYLVAGTWDASGVLCCTPQGAALWQYPAAARPADHSRLFTAQTEPSGQYVLGLSYENARASNATLYLWRENGKGKPLWSRDLGSDSSAPRAAMTPGAGLIAVTYKRAILRGSQTVSEWRLLVLDNKGNTLWGGEKGGLLFSPNLVAAARVSQQTTVLVSDGERALYNLSQDGRITSRYALPGLIRQTLSTPNGRFALLYTGDGTLSLFSLG